MTKKKKLKREAAFLVMDANFEFLPIVESW